MFAGHFGLAAAVKAKAPKVPLWSLLVATQLMDIAFIPLLATNVETFDEQHGNGYGELVIHADYTHSLVGALILALVAGWIAKRVWGSQAGKIIGAVVFSHWILDLIVHRADMPILPGNLGNLPLLGFGVWKLTNLSIALELLLIIVGVIMYTVYKFRSAPKRSSAILSSIGLSVLLIFLLLNDVGAIF
ncbi:MAG: permease [Candidatus Cohnella colombiensis]|uniref:Permease n=1 Tax=Candidatus Cohnella colombiensis TaxID=3121368 RepID=A0AA95JBL2_9BACL|nr:MAG: permease [Cohnella sp.]